MLKSEFGQFLLNISTLEFFYCSCPQLGAWRLAHNTSPKTLTMIYFTLKVYVSLRFLFCFFLIYYLLISFKFSTVQLHLYTYIILWVNRSNMKRRKSFIFKIEMLVFHTYDLYETFIFHLQITIKLSQKSLTFCQ